MSGLKQTFVTKLTDVTSVQQEPLGCIRVEGVRIYKYCQIMNSATVAGAAGSLVSYFAVTGYASSRVVVRAADADGVPIPAGALCATVAGVAATAYYGWVQTKGPCTLDTAVTTPTVGAGFTMTTTDKTGTVAVSGDLKPYAGISLNATTGVLLDCLL
jgi:hypothetical protein